MPPEPARILIIDDEASVTRVLATQLEARGYQVSVMHDGAAALMAYDDLAPEAVVVDLWMTGLGGLQVLKQIRERDAAATLIMLSGDIDVRTTVQALRAGAEDVQTKPVDIELLIAAIDRGLQRSRLMRTYRVASTQISDPYGFFDDSPPMRRMTRLLERLSQATTPVLIAGEHGTGKGLVAEMIHQLSPRGGRPFVRVSAAALDTAALDARDLVTQVAGGTLFVEDLHRAGPRAQEFLLSVLTVTGANSPGAGSSARIVASTVRDLTDDVRAGAFRSDLCQRIAVLPLTVPPLRTRGAGAIRSLALQMLNAQRVVLGRGPTRIGDEALALLTSLEWPGNVRQMRAVIEEAFLVAIESKSLEPMHLRDVVERSGLDHATEGAAPDPRSLEQVERRHIARILAETGGQRTDAARILGITRTTLYKKMKDYGLEEVGAE